MVFLGPSGWERDHRLARVARDSDGSGGAGDLRQARRSPANRVVDVYLADVEIGEDGAPTPLHYREKMRVKGPSVRRDLGKQAGAAQARESDDDRA